MGPSTCKQNITSGIRPPWYKTPSPLVLNKMNLIDNDVFKFKIIKNQYMKT